MMMEEEIGVMQLQAKEDQEPPEEARRDSSLEPIALPTP